MMRDSIIDLRRISKIVMEIIIWRKCCIYQALWMKYVDQFMISQILFDDTYHSYNMSW